MQAIFKLNAEMYYFCYLLRQQFKILRKGSGSYYFSNLTWAW